MLSVSVPHVHRAAQRSRFSYICKKERDGRCLKGKAQGVHHLHNSRCKAHLVQPIDRLLVSLAIFAHSRLGGQQALELLPLRVKRGDALLVGKLVVATVAKYAVGGSG